MGALRFSFSTRGVGGVRTFFFFFLSQQLLSAMQKEGWRNALFPGSDTLSLRNAAFLGYGITLTCSLVLIRRYYLNVTFQLEYLWLAGIILHSPWKQHRQRIILLGIALAQLAISIQFLRFVHDHHGAPQGDCGIGYSSQRH